MVAPWKNACGSDPITFKPQSDGWMSFYQRDAPQLLAPIVPGPGNIRAFSFASRDKGRGRKGAP